VNQWQLFILLFLIVLMLVQSQGKGVKKKQNPTSHLEEKCSLVFSSMYVRTVPDAPIRGTIGNRREKS
jgi:hypothetical protein